MLCIYAVLVVHLTRDWDTSGVEVYGQQREQSTVIVVQLLWGLSTFVDCLPAPSPHFEGQLVVLLDVFSRFIIQILPHVLQVLSVAWFDRALRVLQLNGFTSHVHSDEHPVPIADVNRDIQYLEPLPSIFYELASPST